jgi:hypothetical protein
MSYATYTEYLATDQFRWACGIVEERSGGRCESCRSRMATEFHHVRYCKWGQYDPPENLEHICHQCHCDKHRCVKCGQVALKAKHIKLCSFICDRCNNGR